VAHCPSDPDTATDLRLCRAPMHDKFGSDPPPPHNWPALRSPEATRLRKGTLWSPG